jgi:hypothetical protein
MRILTTSILSVFLVAAAPVLVGIGVNADPAPEVLNRETVIAKNAPDGTWPFSSRPSAAIETFNYWI